jgi:hypothetical protein
MMLLKKQLIILLTLFSIHVTHAQITDTLDLSERKKMLKEEHKELMDEMKEVKKEADKIAKEIRKLEDTLRVYPIWEKGIFGTLGFNFTRTQDWLSKKESNTAASTIGYTVNAFFNVEEKKYFWNNTIKLNQNWVHFDNRDVAEDVEGFQVASDVFNFNSLWGYKISKKMAASALLEYRTPLLQGRWNNPGSLDFGLGLSWKPIKNMIIAMHPANFNTVFSNSNFDLNSSFGMKTIVEYSRKFFGGIGWTTGFSGFMSYKNKDLDNWAWVNGLSKTFKGVGFGLDISLKQNKQEAISREIEDNPIQWYYIFGISYKF